MGILDKLEGLFGEQSEGTIGLDTDTDFVSRSPEKDMDMEAPRKNNKVVNMSQPEYITLSYFQTYEWKIVATQTINRIWSVDGQIGATEWDIDGHRAIVKRREDYSLENVVTNEVRFGPRTTYDYPEIAQMPTNFNNSKKSQTITVSAHGRSTIWELVVVPTKPSLTFSNVAAGANVVWVKAIDIEGSKIEFVYRKKGTEEWTKIDEQWYATDTENPYNRKEAGYVKAVIRGLEPNTDYEVSGYTDGKLSEEAPKAVRTSENYQLPNSQMEEWSQLKNDGSTPTDVNSPTVSRIFLRELQALAGIHSLRYRICSGLRETQVEHRSARSTT